eukprot:5089457-Prymnesium_polylepis.1
MQTLRSMAWLRAAGLLVPARRRAAASDRAVLLACRACVAWFRMLPAMLTVAYCRCCCNGLSILSLHTP